MAGWGLGAAGGAGLSHWCAAVLPLQRLPRPAAGPASRVVGAHEVPQRVDDVKVGGGGGVKVKGVHGVGHGARHACRHVKLPRDLGHMCIQAQLVPVGRGQEGGERRAISCKSRRATRSAMHARAAGHVCTQCRGPARQLASLGMGLA